MSASIPDDVLILGGGVIGLSCAHYLIRAGRRVRVLEQGVPGQGSSHGNCGTLTPSHALPLAAPGVLGKALAWMLRPDAPLYVRPRFDPALWAWLLRFARRCNRRDCRRTTAIRAELLRLSRRLIQELVEGERLDCEFSDDGLLYVFRDSEPWQGFQREHEPLREFGIEWSAWDAARLSREEPALREGLAGGVYFPGDACVRPDRFVAELARRVREAGGEIETRCRVAGFERERGRIVAVRTERGPRRAAEVVLAMGAWSPTWARELGVRLPIQPGKGYSITYRRPALVPTRPLVLKERSVCVTTWSGGFRLGSTMEFSGYDSRLNPTRLGALIRGAAEYLREPEGPEHVEDWYGWRPMTWDDLPIIGRAPGLANLSLATGHGMLGVSMSAATGHLLADLLCGREPVLDAKPFAPDRFG